MRMTQCCTVVVPCGPRKERSTQEFTRRVPLIEFSGAETMLDDSALIAGRHGDKSVRGGNETRREG